MLAWAAHGADLRLHELVRGAPYMADFLRRMFPPNLDYAPALLGPTLETLQMAIWGTLLAIGLAAPLGVLAARNLTPHPVCFWTARGLLNAMRGINELVFALVFVAAVGLGPLPGVLALAVHTAGMLGKFYAEAMEGVDPGPVEALAATGAGRLQTIRYAVLPQVLPAVVAFNLYRLEVSVRSATVLGLVGAGGIGFELMSEHAALQVSRRRRDPRRDRRPRRPDRRRLHARPQTLPVRRLPCACRSSSPSRSSSAWPRCSRPCREGQDRVLRFALTPSEETTDQQMKRSAQVIQRLEKDLDMRVIPYTAADYVSIVEAMRAKKVDVAWLGSFSYVLAVQEAGAEAFVAGVRKSTGKASYTSLIFVRGDAPYQSVMDLKGKSFAFVDPASTSGHLFPRAGMMKMGSPTRRASSPRSCSPARTTRPSWRC